MLESVSRSLLLRHQSTLTFPRNQFSLQQTHGNFDAESDDPDYNDAHYYKIG